MNDLIYQDDSELFPSEALDAEQLTIEDYSALPFEERIEALAAEIREMPSLLNYKARILIARILKL